MRTTDFESQSNVRLPVSSDGSATSLVDIRPINAELIVSMKQAQQQIAPTQIGGPDAVDQTTQVTELQYTLNPDEASQYEASANYEMDYEYKVGPADILTIIVWDHPELTIPAGAERSAEQSGTVVGNDGNIFYPYAGVMKVAGKTLAEIRAVLTERLSNYIEEVKLDVRVAQYNHKRVYVVGAVLQPSVHTISNIPPTLIEMVNAAGGLTEFADARNITLTRDGETFRVDLLALYEDGDTSQNVLLQNGDVVNVRDNDFNKIFVIGEVNLPGAFQMIKQRKSLAEALSESGGVNPETSNPGQIFVFRSGRGDSSEPSIYHLDASSPDALILADQFPLEARDVVYVDAADVVRWNRVIQNISGTIGTLNGASNAKFPLFKGGVIR